MICRDAEQHARAHELPGNCACQCLPANTHCAAGSVPGDDQNVGVEVELPPPEPQPAKRPRGKRLSALQPIPYHTQTAKVLTATLPVALLYSVLNRLCDLGALDPVATGLGAKPVHPIITAPPTEVMYWAMSRGHQTSSMRVQKVC